MVVYQWWHRLHYRLLLADIVSIKTIKQDKTPKLLNRIEDVAHQFCLERGLIQVFSKNGSTYSIGYIIAIAA